MVRWKLNKMEKQYSIVCFFWIDKNYREFMLKGMIVNDVDDLKIINPIESLKCFENPKKQ